MNRRLLIVPVVGALAFAGSQVLTGGETDLPPEPVFPTVVGSPTGQNWTDEDWSVNRFVDDPFVPILDGQGPADELFAPLDEVDPLAAEGDEAATEVVTTTVPATSAPAPASTPTTTTTPPPTTTARDLSQAPPLADDGSGVDLPDIDDLPDPLADAGAEPDADTPGDDR